MNFKLFLLGVLLICIPIFRQDFFVSHFTVFPLYFVFFPVGIVVLLWSVSGGKLKRLYILLGICAVIEIALLGSIVYMARYQRYTPLSERYFYWIREQYGFFKSTTNFDANLSQHDSLMGYRFRPGITGRFTNPEFDVEIKTNSLGVRDDEASLQNPSIVVLGDSHGMGWGVEQQERFSEVLEKQLNIKILNTAITSYGTHREAKLLSQVDLDSCKLVIIQYCDNDLDENRVNFPNPQKSAIDARAFEVAGKQNTINKTYYPFKGIFLSVRSLITNAMKKSPPASPTVPAKPVASASNNSLEHAEAFFPYLGRIRSVYKGPIVVFDLGVYNHPIVEEFEKYQATHPTRDTYFFNVHPLLGRPEYFTIDDHINAGGHAKIGLALAEYIRKNGWLRKP